MSRKEEKEYEKISNSMYQFGARLANTIEKEYREV